jgi:hypothetical protein
MSFHSNISCDLFEKKADIMLCSMDTSDSGDSTTDQSYLSIEDFSEFLTGFDNKFPVQYRKGSYAKHFTIEAAGPFQIAPALDDSQLVVSLTNDENAIKVYLRNVAIHMIKANLHSEKKSELSAMIELCRHFNLSYDLKSHVSLSVWSVMCYVLCMCLLVHLSAHLHTPSLLILFSVFYYYHDCILLIITSYHAIPCTVAA